MNPVISVIIPTYNSEDYLAQALKSIFAQTYQNFEIILIDDASTDSTVEIARSFADQRLKIVQNSQNRGVSYGRNCGIAQAQGDWIALLDSDDWYAPERLQELLRLAKHNNADLVADNLLFIRDGESQHWSTLIQENGQEMDSVELIDAVKFVISDRPTPFNAKRNWSLGYTKPLIRREFLLKNKLKYNETVNVGEDFILYLECLRHKANFYLTPQAYYYYRTRTRSLSTRKPTEYLAQSCQITESFMRQTANSPLDSELTATLAQNLIVFQQRLAFYRLLEAVKNRNFVQVLRQIIVTPYVLKYLALKIINMVKKKLMFNLDFKHIELNAPPLKKRQASLDPSK